MSGAASRLRRLLSNDVVREGLKLALEKEKLAELKGEPPAWTMYEVGLGFLAPMIVAEGVVVEVGWSERGPLYRLADRGLLERILREIEPPPPEPPVELPPDLFDNIVGYDDIKKAFLRSLCAPRPVHILLVGPPASAKSTPGYTEIVVLSDRGVEIVRMDELYERVKKGERLYALSINPVTLRAEWKRITGAYRHELEERLLRIRTRSGRSVAVTEGHSLLHYSLEEERLVPIEARNLETGDAIPVLKRFYAPVKKHPAARLQPEIGFLVGAWLAEGSITIWRKDIITEVTNSDTDFLDRCCTGLRLLDPGFHPRKRRKRTIRTYRKQVARLFLQFLDEGFGKDRGKGKCSRHKFIPPWVYCTPEEFRREIIKGYMFGDGRKEDLTFGSVSRRLRVGICLLLNQFGIVTTHREKSVPTGKYYEGNVVASCYDEYAEKIGFFKTCRPKGLGRHEEIYRVPVREYHVRGGLLGTGVARGLLRHLGKVVNADVFWDVVEEIEVLEGREEYVYDISVEDNENFVCANGIVLHNSLFLEEIERLPGAVFITAGTSTRAGIRDIIFNLLPRYLLIDELDKVNNPKDLSALLTWMESGRIVKTTYRGRVEKRGKGWVFAAANWEEKIPWEIRSRFLIFRLTEYSEEEFVEVAATVLIKREGIRTDLAEYIARRVAEISRNVRDAVKIARLARTREEVDEFVEIMKRRSKRLRVSDI